MKTVKIVQDEIDSVKAEIKSILRSDERKDVARKKRLRAKLPQLKQYLLYLETSPTKEYCEKEMDRISNRINEISKLYVEPENKDRFTKSQLSAIKKDFEKMWNLPKLRKQLTSILYILR